MISRVSLVVILSVLTGCAMTQHPTETSPAASPAASSTTLQPLVVNWSQYFRLDYQPESDRPVVRGHIFNDWGATATNIRLLVDGLDPGGRVVEQKIAWLGTQLTPGTKAPFEVSLAQPAASYRVSVFAFDWVQRGSGGEQK